MATYDFTLPDIGEGLHEAEIVGWLVKVGDEVKENDNIVEVQTDKAVVEISAPVSGRIEKFGAEPGEPVKVGETLVLFSGVDEQSAKGEAARETEVPDVPEKLPAEMKEAEEAEQPEEWKPKQRILAAPSVRKAAREAGVDLLTVEATGKGGKILAADLQRHIEEQSAEVSETPEARKPQQAARPETQREPAAEDWTEPIRGTRKAIFEGMTLAQSNAVMCTGVEEVNVTSLVRLRNELKPYAEQQTVKLTFLPFIIKAAARVLKQNPIFNASVDEAKMQIHYHGAVHIGIATSTEHGLLVPVIRHADRKSVLEIAKEIEELTEKARVRKLKAHELTGSTFTISNTGMTGGLFGTPIINYPEVAIMGIHKIEKRPIVVDDEITIGQMMMMSLTFDHRIIDGDPAGRFMNAVKTILQQPELLILDGK